MPGWILTVLGFLGTVSSNAPLIESLLSSVGSYITTTYSAIFGDAAAQTLQKDLTYAEGLVTSVLNDIPGCESFINTTYTSVAQLLAAFPGLAQKLYVTTQVTKASPTLPAGAVSKLIEAAHANVTKTPSTVVVKAILKPKA
jgi:hypothetical protein